MIHVCVPVLRRYDMLRGMLRSLGSSTVPYEVHVIDNGRDEQKLMEACIGFDVDAVVPKRPLGVAESWNWFIKNIPEERVITNDDIVFAPESLALMAAAPGDIRWTREAGFSCFLIRDSCVAKIGLFDETISPGYGYFEDQDYGQRINGLGTKPPTVDCGHVEANVVHLLSKTLEAATRRELGEHHDRFSLARKNYARKWGIDVDSLLENRMGSR